jgi:hypothetical protein
MGSVNIKVGRVSQATVNRYLARPGGGLERNMLKRGVRVQAKARQNLSESPRRIDTGALRASVYLKRISYRGLPGYRIGSRMKYAWYVHEGTGLYGPKHDWIYPKHASLLRFQPKGESNFVYARRVRGMPPNPFLRNALSAAKL